MKSLSDYPCTRRLPHNDESLNLEEGFNPELAEFIARKMLEMSIWEKEYYTAGEKIL